MEGTRDLTPKQVENKNRVLEEFRRRRGRGEEVSLKSIYFKDTSSLGFPKIVESRNARDPNSQQSDISVFEFLRRIGCFLE
ncbi:hypothetical protein Trydic_g6263 [Trypoxylus dichotomus]